MITRKLKYPHVMRDIDIIITRLLSEDVNMMDIAN